MDPAPMDPAPMNPAPMDYVLDDDPDRLDLDAIWGFLSTEAYWHRWRTRKQVTLQVARAWRVVGAYDERGAQVGFARAMSDGVCDAYLADVFVLPGHRGHGLGKRLVATMIEEGPGAHLRWTLFTADAHGLYEQFGFAPPGRSALIRPGRFTSD
jgi:GNAT superfamily N-acetyltransferase